MGAPGKGYKTDADAMAAASKDITTLAEDLQDDNKDLSKTKVKADGFGQAHTAHGEPYTTAVQMLDAAVKGLSGALTGFAGRIGGAGQSYTAGEDAQQANINQAGRQ